MIVGYILLAEVHQLNPFLLRFPSLNYHTFCLGASLVVAIQAVKKGAATEGMKVKDYVWRGHDPTSVAVMTEVILPVPFCTFGF